MVDTSIFDHRPSIFEGRHIDLRSSNRYSTIDLCIDIRPSIFDHRPSIIDLRPSTIDLRRSTHRSSTIDLRPSIFDHRPSTFDHRPSIFDHRPSTFDHRSSTIDHRSSYRSSTIDLRRSKVETSHRQSNIAPTIRHRILSTMALQTIDLRLSIIDLRIDLRTSIFEHRSSKIEGGNIAPTIQHRTDNSSPNIVHNGAPYGDGCVDLRRPMIDVSTFEDR